MNTDKMTVGEFLELLKDIDKNLEIHIVGCCGSCWGVPSVQVQDYKNINTPSTIIKTRSTHR